MAGQNENTIIVKKVIKGGGGHHGGAWKVAYADFVTAMMAFFLLLWLLNVTTDEQKNGIADYFAPTVASKSVSGSGGVLGGVSLSTEGARLSNRSPPSVVLELTPPKQRQVTSDSDQTGSQGEEEDANSDEARELNEQELLERMAEREQEEFREAEAKLRQAIQEVPELSELSRNLVIENTPEGLRIQLVDQERSSMFPSGGSDMQGHTRKLLQKVAEVIQRVPNQVAISGHTDALPFRNGNGYGNWELSADRANASRRTLQEFGVPSDRIASVTGKAATQPLLEDDPTAPMNRRISIVLLRQTPLVPRPGPAPGPRVGPAPGLGGSAN